MRRWALLMLLAACAPEAPPAEDTSDFTRMGPPQPGEWLARFDEPGQTFEQYVAADVNRKSADRAILYIRPLGDGMKKHGAVIEQMREFAQIYFGAEAKLLEPAPMPPNALDRDRGQYDATRVHTTLRESMPERAIAYIGLTDDDLYSKGLNFVFGEGSLRERVGIYSLHRLDSPDPAQFLRRSLKLMCHEVGHIFSIQHCIEYLCCMNGANSLEESDRQPLHLCPTDLRKLAWNMGFDVRARYDTLEMFYAAHGLTDEAAFVRKVKEKLRS